MVGVLFTREFTVKPRKMLLLLLTAIGVVQFATQNSTCTCFTRSLEITVIVDDLGGLVVNRMGRFRIQLPEEPTWK